MISIFTPSAGDKSIEYLNMIFGPMNGVLGPPNLAQQKELLGAMFATFNSVILSVGALIVVYITVMGVVASAHEGQFLGKKFHGLWTPIRVVIGIAAMIPTSSGFSGLQIVMMWVIVQGIGAADTLWNATLQHIATTGSPYPNAPGAQVGFTMQELFKGIVCDATAHKNWRAPSVEEGQPGGYYCRGRQGESFCGPTFTRFDNTANKEKGIYQLGPVAYCGELRFCNVKEVCSTVANQTKASAGVIAEVGFTDIDRAACSACKAQVQVLSSIIPAMRSIAETFVKKDYEYQRFTVLSRNTRFDEREWGFIRQYCEARNISARQCCFMTDNALAAIGGIFTGGANSQCEAKSNTLPNANSTITNPNDPDEGSTDIQGASEELVNQILWPYVMKPIAFGSGNRADQNIFQIFTEEYLSIIGLSIQEYVDQTKATNQAAATMQAFVTASDQGWAFAGTYYYQIAKMNNQMLKAAMPTLEYVVDKPPSDPAIPLSQFRNNYNAAGTLINAMAGAVSGGSAQSSMFSGPYYSAMNTVQSGFSDIIVNNTGIDPISKLQSFGMSLILLAEVLFYVFFAILLIFGFGGITGAAGGFFVTNPLSPIGIMALMLIVPGLYALLGLLVTIGATLGVYVPLIPYIVFTMGVIGWLTSTIEAMVAGPLVALGILSPGGQHELLGKAEGALMLLFNIFLRPSLMIFGLMASMLMARVVVYMINEGFKMVYVAIVPSVSLVLITLFFLVAYVMLTVAALNKCFALIHLIPEKVMRWIGGQGEQYGEGEAMQKVEGGVGSAAGKAAGAAGAVGGAAVRAREASGKKKDDDGKGNGGGPDIKPAK